MAEITFRKFQQLQLNPDIDNGKSVGLLFTVTDAEAPIGLAANLELLHEMYQRIPDLLAAAHQARARAGIDGLAPIRTNFAGWCTSECRLAIEADEVRIEYRLGEDCTATLRMPRDMAARMSAEMAVMLGGSKHAPAAAPSRTAARTSRVTSGAQGGDAGPRRSRPRSPGGETATQAKRASPGRAPAKRKASKSSR